MRLREGHRLAAYRASVHNDLPPNTYIPCFPLKERRPFYLTAANLAQLRLWRIVAWLLAMPFLSAYYYARALLIDKGGVWVLAPVVLAEGVLPGVLLPGEADPGVFP